MERIKRKYIIITGIVQGVGFRPFVYRLAKSLSLSGWVNNSSQGVIIDIEGSEGSLSEFLRQLKSEAPPLSKIMNIETAEMESIGYSDFIIKESITNDTDNIFISPDISICPECERELREPLDRRFKYPFINCTNCGPRFSIIKGSPYDRDKTTMSEFEMCNSCKEEYSNPLDRRYHAQPVSCFDCGPELWLTGKDGTILEKGTDALPRTADLLKEGSIIAIKGIGGYHLACNALDSEAVVSLRKRKERDDKPFAIMVRDFEAAQKFCYINEAEKELLESYKKPIVLLKKREACRLPAEISPGNPYLGIILPYTPVHLILLDSFEALVMTSGNRSSEPIYFKDNEAISNLSHIADYFLTNNREIYIRTDDSVTRIVNGKEYILRRSRGYVPMPISINILDISNSLINGLKDKKNINIFPSVLACGGEQKNTFCINKGEEFFISHHIGDLENLETLRSFEEGIEHFKTMFKFKLSAIAYDLHPEYLSTKYALDSNIEHKLPIQHHHAHVASCMAENNLNEEVIGVAFDGTGYGEDGNLWGGEFFTADYKSFSRSGYFDYVKMPGGEKAVREPWRMAVSYLVKAFGIDELKNYSDNKIKSGNFLPDIKREKIRDLIKIMDRNINCPLTSSAGRLFDAVAALLGIRSEISYEGQAAVELEYIASSHINEVYNFVIIKNENNFIINVDKMIREIYADLNNGVKKDSIAAKFHETMASIIVEGCTEIRNFTGLYKVVLSGGVFQNLILLESVIKKLRLEGFLVYTHSRVPSNDGGVSLGQAVIALHRFTGN